MGLITPEYMELQKELHERGGYGTFHHRDKVLFLVEAMMKRDGFSTCLDYGCGQGGLKLAVGDCVTEYDPCIDGKDDDPEPADLVVCTDVLEHIEPDCLDDVLGHMRSKLKDSKSRLIFTVALRPANKQLADGRNAHIIVQPEDWWRSKLQHFFRVTNWAVQDGNHIIGVAERVNIYGKIKSVAVLSNDERNEHTRLNVVKATQRLPREPVSAHDDKILLACYGPSLAQTFDLLLKQRADGGLVVSVSGAHDYLRSRDVVPDYHVECDPRAHKAGMLTDPSPKTKFLMASCCHPSVIDKLANSDLTLWHMLNSEDTLAIREIPSEKFQPLIPGGGSVGLRALPLFYFLGYRKFNIHGMDCSFGDTGRHAGPHTGKPVDEKIIRPKVNLCFGEAVWSEREFRSAPIMAVYAEQFATDIRLGRYPGAQITLHGDGMLVEIMRLEALQRQSLAQAAAAFGFELKPIPTRDYFSLTEDDLSQHQENAA